MRLKARFLRYRLHFSFVAITSRESLTYKDTYFIILEKSGRVGIGECPLFRGLSCDDTPDYEQILQSTCRALELGEEIDLTPYPSIRFGVETAQRSLASADPFRIFDTAWSRGEESIKINGLVWMGSADTMRRRVKEKLEQGFRCIKLKVGGIDFDDELSIIKSLRQEFSPDDLEIRLDANGGFTAENALPRLELLSRYSIHSIEQPVKAGQPELMAKLCYSSPIDIALDEELIGINKKAEKEALLSFIRPRYVILKPALVGGFNGSDEWIEAANAHDIEWWATSALESNLGLNAIAQWCSTKLLDRPQGLGTGMLYTNNITSPLELRGDSIIYNPANSWQLPSELT